MGFGWFNARVNPIAVDIGTDSIKALQVEPREGTLRLYGAASVDIPEELRTRIDEREAFVVDALRKLLGDGTFKGRQVVTCLPAAAMAVQHLRLPKMSPEEIQKALPFEAQGKLPFEPGRAVLRHMIAGEVYVNQETKTEVILLAAPRDAVERHLNTLSKAKAEVVGIHVEPTALIGCFAHLFKRKGDENISTMFIDMGAGSTHVVIAHGTHLVFAKHIQIGGDLLTRRVADALKVNMKQAREMRLEAAQRASGAHKLPAGVVSIGDTAKGSHPLGDGTQRAAAAIISGKIDVTDELMQKIVGAMVEPVETLVSELSMCISYYESIFPGKSIDRAIFVGGESKHVLLCQVIAQRLGLPATLGDPLARLSKDAKTNSNLDFRMPQPAWAIAVGLSAGVSEEKPAAEKPDKMNERIEQSAGIAAQRAVQSN